jgi:hypothetical protein
MISNNFVTKSLVFKEESGERFFEGLLTVEMVDRQGEVTVVDSLYKCLPIWMDRGGAISDTHSNRIVGKGINYARTTLTTKDGRELPALKIIGKIFNHTQLDNEIWGKIKSGEYKGLSFGGATTSDATPVQQSDGSIAFHLKDIEMYEIAVCEDPAVPFALITATNDIAKSNAPGDDYVVKEDDDEDVIIKCEEKGCYIAKANVTKPLPTKWGKEQEFSECETSARNDDDIRNPEGYCGAIQSTVDGAKKTDDIVAEVKENTHKDDKFSSQKPLGVNPIDDKDLKDIPIGKNHNDSGSTTNAQDDEDIKEIKISKEHKEGCPCKKGTEWHQSEGLTKPKDDKDLKEISIAKEHEEGCPCKKESNPPKSGVRGLGAGATAIQGAGHSAQITEEKKEEGISAETLGNPDRLKKPGDITQDRPSSMKCKHKCSKCGKNKNYIN